MNFSKFELQKIDSCDATADTIATLLTRQKMAEIKKYGGSQLSCVRSIKWHP